MKECVKLQLLMFAPADTEESDRELREATTSSSITSITIDTTDDGETHLPPRNQNLVQLLHYLLACHGLTEKG